MRSSRLLYSSAHQVLFSHFRCSRLMSTQQRPPNKNFFQNLIDNVQDELKRNKELQESKKVLEQRLRELNNSEARKKFDKIEKDTSESTAALVQRLGEVTTYVNRMMTDLKSSEAAKEAMRQAKVAAEALERAAQTVGDTQVYKHVASTAKEVDKLADVRMYSRPEELKMRSTTHAANFARVVEADTSSTGIQLHKDSRWYAGWSSFAESNSYYNKLLDWKIRFDESENPAARMLRGVTDRIAYMLTSKSEVSDVLTEISKIDSSFDKAEWLRFCEKEVVPNILEAYIRGDLSVLEDWCYERAFNMLATVVKENQTVGYSMADSHIIDVSKMELVSGKMMEQGPVLVITFQVYLIEVVKNREGKVIQGDATRPKRVQHVWVMCRDMEEFNPHMAWKLLELHVQDSGLLI